MRRSLALVLLLTACPRSSVLGPRFVHPQDAPDAADSYYAAKRTGTPDPQRAYAVARAQMRRLRSATEDQGPTTEDRLPWSFLGPDNIGGRTRSLVIDPADPNTMYAGGVSGGVWKTVDGGGRWQAVGDELANLAVNSLAMDPRDRNVVYAGTGEGYFREEVRGTGLPLRGNGIFVTGDGGVRWTQLPSTSNPDFQWVNDLAISEHDSRRIYAATRSGVWRSIDGGGSWNNVLPTTVKGGCLDLALRSGGAGDFLFASCGTFERATIYRAKNAESDQPWTEVLSDPLMGRTTLAIAPSRPSTIYALAASNVDQALLAVFRSDNDGDAGTWTARVQSDSQPRLSTLILTNPISASQRDCGGRLDSPVTMGWYCNTIAVDPKDPERVFAAGVDLFRSDDGGSTWGLASYWWGDTPSYAHADQHNIVFHPNYDGAANQTLFLANDGGVYRTDNARAAVATGNDAPCDGHRSGVILTSLVHNLGITQFYNGAAFPDGRQFLGGAQDNSTLIGSTTSPSWRTEIGGDGGYVAVDPVDPSHVYAEYQFANIFRSDDGGKTFATSARKGLNDNFLFVTPFVIDARQPMRLWTGGTRMWRTDDRGTNWRQASVTLSAQVSAIAIDPRQSDHVLAGMNDGSIYATRAGSSAGIATQWSRAAPRDGWVSSIAFDPIDSSTVYATYAGFGGKHVWKSSDGGTTWTAVDADLPDIPAHSLAVDPFRRDHLYLGTDLGVFVSSDGGAHWHVENTGFAAVVTESVFIGQGERGPAVYAFTHGRGAWRAELVETGRRRAVRR
ncbi:MAG TPA: hypothetical protein VLV78_18540 [Thermoanaerobaculia bacterium]|nr:hypothetical protein [Thermoanaerobaculia bacterium]